MSNQDKSAKLILMTANVSRYYTITLYHYCLYLERKSRAKEAEQGPSSRLRAKLTLPEDESFDSNGEGSYDLGCLLEDSCTQSPAHSDIEDRSLQRRAQLGSRMQAKPIPPKQSQTKSLSRKGLVKSGKGSQDKGISASLGPLGYQRISTKSDRKANEKGKLFC